MRKHLILNTMAVLLLVLCGCGEDSPPADQPDDGTSQENGPDIVAFDQAPKVLLEAETAACKAPYAIGEDAEASGGKYITVAPISCDGKDHTHLGDALRKSGQATIEFEVAKDGDYVIWFRKWSCCSCGDSWLVKLDDRKAVTFGNEGTTHRHWTWICRRDGDDLVKVSLKSGKHKMVFSNRGESGFRIDQVLLWADTKRVPQGKER
jgi:hypothetical protein